MRGSLPFSSIVYEAAAISVSLLLCSYCIAGTTIEVPARPAPGSWGHQLPDSSYIDAARSFAELTETFSALTARGQISKAKRVLANDTVQELNREIELKLNVIEARRLSQAFDIDPTRTTITRYPELGGVVVTLSGRVAGADDCSAGTMSVQLRTAPRNTYNEYGIVISGYTWNCSKE